MATQTNNYKGLVQKFHKGIDYIHIIVYKIHKFLNFSYTNLQLVHLKPHGPSQEICNNKTDKRKTLKEIQELSSPLKLVVWTHIVGLLLCAILVWIFVWIASDIDTFFG